MYLRREILILYMPNEKGDYYEKSVDRGFGFVVSCRSTEFLCLRRYELYWLTSGESYRVRARKSIWVGGNSPQVRKIWKNGLALYDIEFRTDNAKLDYETIAVSGEVIGRHYKALQRLHNKNLARILGCDKRISETDAKAAAMKHAGISEASLREHEIELDERRGRLFYE